MSSKFRDLLTQARNRPSEDEQEEVDEQEKVEAPSEHRATSPRTPSRLEPAKPARQTVPDSLPAASTAKRGRPRNGKRSDPNFTQITAYISKKTHQDVKVALLQEGEGRELSELVEECLAFWLQHQ